jgi:hypothetical protein
LKDIGEFITFMAPVVVLTASSLWVVIYLVRNYV